MSKKQMFGVEYISAGGGQTFDVFLTMKDAKQHFTKIKAFKTYKPLFIFQADFNEELIYKDENGTWNYDDYSDLLLSEIQIIRK